MAEKQTNKERLKEITDGIEQGIKELFESDRYRQYLSVMSRFHRYSVNNTMLIYMQRPDASLVAGFQKWKNQFGRHVKKGERGITIIAPTPFKKKIEEVKLDPDTQAPLLDKDGKQIMEEKEISIPLFKPVKVFDVSQTDGKPIPHLASALTGTVEQYEIFMEALRRSAPVPISFTHIAPDTDGYFSPTDQSITIREGMSEVQTVCATIHEIAHSKLHNYDKMQQEAETGDETEEPVKPKDRNTEEVEAESVSYAVCQYYGIETAENSFGYIATWSQGKELKELRASLETINKTCSELISDIDHHFAAICKERGIDLTADSQEKKDPIAELAADIDAFAYDYDLYEYKDTVEDREQAVSVLAASISSGDVQHIRDWLQPVLDEPNEDYTPQAQALLTRLNELAPVPDLEQAKDSEPAPPLGGGDNVDAEITSHDPNDSFPEIPEQVLDTYPMPDEALEMGELEACGYLDCDMLPISREQAQEYLDNGFSVYSIFDGGGASMCFDQADIDAAPAELPFAISREEWEESSAFHDKILERQQHQEEREAAFLAHEGDCFAIYQVSRDDPNNVRFMNMDWMQSHSLAIERGNYDLIYTAPLDGSGSTMEQLEKLYEQFNLQKPVDFHCPSMSVSDIVAIKQGGKVSCHYCDSVGFQELPGFLLQDNPLKNAEMSMEDDYGMIDGIINNGPKQPTVAELEAQVNAGQTISLLDLANAVQTERNEKSKEQKPSILERLKQPTPERKTKSAHKNRAEMELS